MATHSEAVLMELTIALRAICWRKKDLKAFVELTPNVGAIVANIQWKNRSRREIATELVGALTKAGEQEGGQLDDIAARICTLPDSFIDQKHVNDRARGEAKRAVMALRNVMGLSCKTANPVSDAVGEAKDLALAAPSPTDPNRVAPADAGKELVNKG